MPLITVGGRTINTCWSLGVDIAVEDVHMQVPLSIHKLPNHNMPNVVDTSMSIDRENVIESFMHNDRRRGVVNSCCGLNVCSLYVCMCGLYVCTCVRVYCTLPTAGFQIFNQK